MILDPELSYVKEIISISKQQRENFFIEFEKLKEYYTKNSFELLSSLMNIANMNKEKYMDKIIADNAAKLISNFGQNNFEMHEAFILDSYEKIHRQINWLPQSELEANEKIKIISYDLRDQPNKTGSRLMLVNIHIAWRKFETEYLTIFN